MSFVYIPPLLYPVVACVTALPPSEHDLCSVGTRALTVWGSADSVAMGTQ